LRGKRLRLEDAEYFRKRTKARGIICLRHLA
jgi:hypothetical protein